MEQGQVELKQLSQVTQNIINQHRQTWEIIAKDKGWHTEPFYIQAWVHSNGTVFDVAGHRGMAEAGKDIIIVDDHYEDEEDWN